HQAAPAAGQVVRQLRRVQREPLEVDHVDVRLVARRQQTAIAQSHRERRGAAEPVHQPRQRQAPLGAVAPPVHQRERRVAAVADRGAVRAAVAQPRQHVGMAQHGAQRIELALGVVGHREIERGAALAFQHQVVGELPGAAARAPGARGCS
ncbi:MAG: hypothetical protein KBG29_10535, partial [Pseudomonadales bacterium]|nr:hypothetical protein [Pseudomonadales bacterium]